MRQPSASQCFTGSLGILLPEFHTQHTGNRKKDFFNTCNSFWHLQLRNSVHHFNISCNSSQICFSFFSALHLNIFFIMFYRISLRETCSFVCTNHFLLLTVLYYTHILLQKLDSSLEKVLSNLTTPPMRLFRTSGSKQLIGVVNVNQRKTLQEGKTGVFHFDFFNYHCETKTFKS